MNTYRVCRCIAVAAGLCTAVRADLTVLTQFNTTPAAGLAYDHGTGGIWVYPTSGATIDHYSPSGTLLSSIPRPGEAASHADLDLGLSISNFAGVSLNLPPASVIYFINGESGVAEIYAINKLTGAVIATLTTSFGDGHVVGGAFSHQTLTFFLIQSAASAGSNANRVAQINRNTGAVIQSWQTTTAAPGFTVGSGDLEVAGNGNLLIVSSDQATIGEFTTTGGLVALRQLPTGVSALSGVGVSQAPCEAWVVETNGQVARLGGLQGEAVCGTCYANCDASTLPPALNVNDFACFLSQYASGHSQANCDASTSPPILNVGDFVCFLNFYAAAGC